MNYFLFYYLSLNYPLYPVSEVVSVLITLDNRKSTGEYFCRRANRKLGFILRFTRGIQNPLALRALFCSLVRQFLGYACCTKIWSFSSYSNFNIASCPGKVSEHLVLAILSSRFQWKRWRVTGRSSLLSQEERLRTSSHWQKC